MRWTGIKSEKEIKKEAQRCGRTFMKQFHRDLLAQQILWMRHHGKDIDGYMKYYANSRPPENIRDIFMADYARYKHLLASVYPYMRLLTKGT